VNMAFNAAEQFITHQVVEVFTTLIIDFFKAVLRGRRRIPSVASILSQPFFMALILPGPQIAIIVEIGPRSHL